MDGWMVDGSMDFIGHACFVVWFSLVLVDWGCMQADMDDYVEGAVAHFPPVAIITGIECMVRIRSDAKSNTLRKQIIQVGLLVGWRPARFRTHPAPPTRGDFLALCPLRTPVLCTLFAPSI